MGATDGVQRGRRNTERAGVRVSGQVQVDGDRSVEKVSPSVLLVC